MPTEKQPAVSISVHNARPPRVTRYAEYVDDAGDTHHHFLTLDFGDNRVGLTVTFDDDAALGAWLGAGMDALMESRPAPTGPVPYRYPSTRDVDDPRCASCNVRAADRSLVLANGVWLCEPCRDALEYADASTVDDVDEPRSDATER